MVEMDLVESIRSVLEERDVALAILFGSRATGTARADSDVDLAVELDEELTLQRKLALIEVLAERLGLPIDLVDLRTVGEPLLGEILGQGKRLLGTDEAFADLLCRHLHDAADFLPYVNRMLAERRAAWLSK